MTDEQSISVYSKALTLALTRQQCVGEKNDYYITLAQLEQILLAEKGER